ncbi:hypothetical protein J2W21_003007 [Sinomonas atrocyanea]|uniref:hypothetical protein n=1 Tax=Sinomonas atrocyanea TaxID=37927 RepID=UPI002784E67E|nr:hypothetical protein [Sinomonas atrocyanea]MDP9885484.1 hypothetical protein [Sinomonas atrocyanea]
MDSSEKHEEEDKPKPRKPFQGVATSFRHSMDAVIELADFANEHVHALDDLIAGVRKEIQNKFPDHGFEMSSLAAETVVRHFTALDEAKNGGSGETLEQEELERSFRELTRKIQEVIPHKNAPVHCVMAYINASARPKRASMLFDSLLTTAVGNFEVLVSAIVREFLRLRPAAIRSDETRYSLADIEDHETLDDFRAYCAERYAEGLLRGGFDDWMGFFEKRVRGVSIDSIAADTVQLREVFQRRHLVVHNGGIVNNLYLTKMKTLAPKPKVGSRLVVEYEYLQSAIDHLTVAGVLLQFRTMKALLKDEQSGAADAMISKAVYDLLSQARWSAALHIAQSAHPDCSSEQDRIILRVNAWLAKKRISGAVSIRREVEAWQVEALAPRFKMARLALLDDTKAAYDLGKRLVEIEELAKEEWRTWPLLEEVRAYELSLQLEEASGAEPADAIESLASASGVAEIA